MRIFCLIAFVFLATSFTTNNKNFEKISNSENLKIKKPKDVYRVNAFQKKYGYGGAIEWEKVPIKINVTSSYTGKSITVLEVYINFSNSWKTIENYDYTYRVEQTHSLIDGEDLFSRFDYKAGTLYFNI